MGDDRLRWLSRHFLRRPNDIIGRSKSSLFPNDNISRSNSELRRFPNGRNSRSKGVLFPKLIISLSNPPPARLPNDIISRSNARLPKCIMSREKSFRFSFSPASERYCEEATVIVTARQTMDQGGIIFWNFLHCCSFLPNRQIISSCSESKNYMHITHARV